MAIGKHSENEGSAVFVAVFVCVVLAAIGATIVSIRDSNQPNRQLSYSTNLHLPVK